MKMSFHKSLRMINRYIKRIGQKGVTSKFDPLFYYNQYEDLRHLKTIEHLKGHYIAHGRPEGRMGNGTALIEEQKRLLIEDAESFDLSAYKFYNRDLVKNFKHDDDFLKHYVVHGRNEGRRCLFPAQGELGDDLQLGPGDRWQAIFSMSQLIAWCGERLEKLPATKREAIDLFKERGIAELWPINFEYAFDPDFYRINYKIDKSKIRSDTDLYRHWLSDGFDSDLAPNENVYLYSFLGGSPYPVGFDWRGYAAHVRMKKKLNRITSLKHLFENFGAVEELQPFMNRDAYSMLSCIGKYLLIRGHNVKAITVFERALLIKKDAELYCLLGDAFQKNNKKDKALWSYRQSTNHEDCPIWSYIHIIELSCNQGKFDDAFTALRQAFNRWQQTPEFVRALDSCIERYFQHQSAVAHKLYREFVSDICDGQSRVCADNLMTETLDTIKCLYADLGSLPQVSPGPKHGYVAFLANDDLQQCTHYRVEQKSYQFEAAKIELRTFSHRDVRGFEESLIGAKSAIFYRVAATPNVIRAILLARRMGLPTFYEIDDLIFDSAAYPDSFDSFEGQISLDEYAGLQFGVPLFRFAMSMCESSIASTRALASEMQALVSSGSGLIVRNGLDVRNDTAIQIGAAATVTKSDKIRIFYGSGTKAHNADFNEVLAPVLINIMTFDERVELVIVGHLKLCSELESFGARVKIYSFISDVEAYWSVLASCDINLAVLHPGRVADCKSEIKWLEAAILRIPSVVSNTETYRDVVDDGVNGYIAVDGLDWQLKLAALVADEGLRQKIGAEARIKALRDYGTTPSTDIWQRAFSSKDSPKLPGVTTPKLRVLICNVFFFPQSIGGATRVVEDNVRFFTEECDDLEIGVFCSDDGGIPGKLRVSRFGDVPVYRLGTTVREGMDWHPFDENNRAAFEQALDHFRPDLVHFHCIQRLSASIVEVARQRKLPYVVTLHDGWWISDNQFLVDENGSLKLPTNDILADCAYRRDAVPSIVRRQRLRSLLASAEARLSVSDPFALIYDKAGIAAVKVVENGVSKLVAVDRNNRSDGRLALGHVGGRASHKGAYLIESALRQGDYTNLHLTMIDGSLPPGKSIDTVWGKTPVTLSAPHRQSAVSELYSLFNVLLAPSTWPESFGLVTREALSLDLWVVASNLGAIGQGIKDGQNGYVIDTRTTHDLNQVFYTLDSDHNRFKVAPSLTDKTIARPTADQARELRSLYWQVCDWR